MYWIASARVSVSRVFNHCSSTPVRIFAGFAVSAIGYLFSLGGVTPAVFKYLASSSGDVMLCQSSMLRMIPASSSSSVGSGSLISCSPSFERIVTVRPVPHFLHHEWVGPGPGATPGESVGPVALFTVASPSLEDDLVFVAGFER